MPNIKGAEKRMRTSEKSRQRNVAAKSKIRNIRRTVLAEATPEGFKAYCAALDKAAKKGIISRNTAIRRKRRASARVKVPAPAAAPVAAPAV